ncbi:hypothetical protein [Bartonella massiliensis]|uniref:hypothetical protein n=1 Tax=Bartonella massiliensis TaxID=929795 RepID=UPI00115B8848|nr:hypothetical protein [Bartonella massiliensis]
MTSITVSKKYELINESHVKGITLYRIRSLRDFDDVKKGDLGGYIESEDNLSHDGNCWVYDNACVVKSGRVYENAKVYGNATIGGFVYGNAYVCDKTRVYFGAHVYDNAHLSDKAWVYQHARVYGNAKLSGSARIHSNAVVYDHAVVSGAAKIYGKVYGNASVGGYVKVYGSVYGNAKVTGYHTIRGLVHGNARLKRDGYSYTEQNPYYAYGIPEDCEIYENDTVVKIVKNKAA